MKQMDVFKKIGGILQELNDQYDYLKAESSDLNELELELFVANAQFLRDHAEILRKMHERETPVIEKQELPVVIPEPVVEKPKPIIPQPANKPEPIHERRFFEPVVQQKPVVETKLQLSTEPESIVQVPFNPVKVEAPEPEAIEEEPQPEIELSTANSDDVYSFELEEQEAPIQVIELNEATEPVPVIEIPEPVVVAEAKPVIEPAAQSELFKPMVPKAEPVKDEGEKVLTFNQKLFAQRAEKENSSTTQANVLPITDLKSAINLNDKLLYIKDLFNGYSLAYSEAIEIVNRFNTFEEAERFLKTNYVAKNNWESKPATTEKFYTLLKRRYPTV
ncbi:hypothetical protein [Mucilaginibacter dorajii]|uniref:Uncharacterized protein n=1 Tax=Mucilaginibacter dorajii TaxID=692994 RepID=A0ABP7Q387_9SPHI|nr:hypothetical protein [Mucilaginibacter dorajii]MCS3732714.1 hypothetical protein [Mucilaginibacter dorajii]